MLNFLLDKFYFLSNRSIHFKKCRICPRPTRHGNGKLNQNLRHFLNFRDLLDTNLKAQDVNPI